MKKWTGEIIRILAVIVFMFVIVLTTRMHAFLAVPVIVLSYIGYMFLVVWSERFDDDHW